MTVRISGAQRPVNEHGQRNGRNNVQKPRGDGGIKMIMKKTVKIHK
jgi:hypothetical protein